MKKIIYSFFIFSFFVLVMFSEGWSKSIFDTSSSILKIYDLSISGTEEKYEVELLMDLSSMKFQILNIRNVFPFNGCYVGIASGEDNARLIFCVKDGKVIHALTVNNESDGFWLSGEGTVSPSGDIRFFLVGEDTNAEVTGKLTPAGGSGFWYDHIEGYSGTWEVQKIDY